MKAIGEMSLVELAAFVQTALEENGIEVILSGGAAVSYYSGNVYTSNDVDLVNAFFANRQSIKQTLHVLGFEEAGRHFTHPDTIFLVEFPAGPLAVGSEPVQEVRSYSLETGTLKIISPTDVVKDRLLAFFHWGDRQSLEQARLVSGQHPIDLGELGRWARAEDLLEAYQAVQDQLRSD